MEKPEKFLKVTFRDLDIPINEFCISVITKLIIHNISVHVKKVIHINANFINGSKSFYETVINLEELYYK
jgi:hypothetical protein